MKKKCLNNFDIEFHRLNEEKKVLVLNYRAYTLCLDINIGED